MWSPMAERAFYRSDDLTVLAQARGYEQDRGDWIRRTRVFNERHHVHAEFWQRKDGIYAWALSGHQGTDGLAGIWKPRDDDRCGRTIYFADDDRARRILESISWKYRDIPGLPWVLTDDQDRGYKTDWFLWEGSVWTAVLADTGMDSRMWRPVDAGEYVKAAYAWRDREDRQWIHMDSSINDEGGTDDGCR